MRTVFVFHRDDLAVILGHCSYVSHKKGGLVKMFDEASCVNVTPTSYPGMQHAFKLTFRDQTELIMAAETDEDARRWMTAVGQVSDCPAVDACLCMPVCEGNARCAFKFEYD